MPALVDKSGVTKICVDDFAFRKRYSYGTVMVDLESHRIIDLLDSRETGKVEGKRFITNRIVKLQLL